MLGGYCAYVPFSHPRAERLTGMQGLPPQGHKNACDKIFSAILRYL